MLRPHSENATNMTRQHHTNGLLVVAQLRREGHMASAKAILDMVKRSRLAFGHLWLNHGV